MCAADTPEPCGRVGALVNNDVDQQDSLVEPAEPVSLNDGDTNSDPGEVEETTQTTLVEVEEGLALVFGEVPEGMDLLDLPLMPEEDRSALTSLTGMAGGAAHIAGIAEQSTRAARGLFRMDEVSKKVLETGGKQAQKDGFGLGTISVDGKFARQIRWVKADPSAIATFTPAAGAAVALMALQAQLGNIEDLVAKNIALTRQTLKTIRSEQWSELEATTGTINRAFNEAREVGTVTTSIWEPIRSRRSDIDKQLRLYRKNVAGHISHLRKMDDAARREHLENEAAAILFDSRALLEALRAYAQFRALRAAKVRTRLDADEGEKALFEKLTRETPLELKKDMESVRELIVALTRELRIIAELPGRASFRLSKKRRDKEWASLTTSEMLKVLEPLANTLQPPAAPIELENPPHAPEDADLSEHLGIVRWHLEPGENVETVALAYAVSGSSLVGMVPAVLGRRVDTTWKPQKEGLRGALDRMSGGSLAIVTDRRILVANLEDLRKFARFDLEIPLEHVQLVRVLGDQHGSIRPGVEILSDSGDANLMFPKTVDPSQVSTLAAAIEETRERCAQALKAVERG